MNLQNLPQLLCEYVQTPKGQPRVLYLGDNEMKELYRNYGGILLEVLGCKIVAVERTSYVAFGE